MKSFPIRLRLTASYSVVLAVVLSLFRLSAYFTMRDSIHQTVDDALQDRHVGVRGLIERTSPYGTDDLQRELREHSELAGGALLQVSDQQGNWLYRSNSMALTKFPGVKELRPRLPPLCPRTFRPGSGTTAMTRPCREPNRSAPLPRPSSQT